MKPVDFDYLRPRSVDAALDLLATRDNAKVLAGGQTLGPMLNLRLVQPALLIDITRIEELVSVNDTGDTLAIGACVTHAAIEDNRVADPVNGYLRNVARGIAYRAVRTRGTVGGSLAHADPAADWLSALLVAGAELEIAGNGGARRKAPLTGFVRGAMETELGADELLVRIDVPKAGSSTRHGYYKICRKTGEFAEAIGACAFDEAAGRFRMVAAGGSERPVRFDDANALFTDGDPANPDGFDMDRAMDALRASGMEQDDYDLRLRAVAMNRAHRDAMQA